MAKIQEFSCMRDGLTIRGRQFLPDDWTEGTMLPVAILSHVFVGDQTRHAADAQRLASWGWAAYTFDFNGGSEFGISDGKTWDMSVLTEVEDLLKVIEYVEKLPFTDMSRLVLFGFSQGGFVSALAAAQLGEKVHKLVLYYPGLRLPADARRGRMLDAVFDPHNVPERFQCGPLVMGRRYAEDVMNLGPYEEISAYSGPVLILHGRDDAVVDITYSQKAWECYTASRTGSRLHPDRNVQLVMLSRGGHGLEEKGMPEKAAACLREFLDDRTCVLTVDTHMAPLPGFLPAQETGEQIRPFHGAAVGPWFRGSILAGAEEVRQLRDFVPVERKFSFRLEGLDHSGRECFVTLEAELRDGKWSCRADSDSEVLRPFLSDCRLAVEDRPEGSVLRVYGK